MRSLGIFSHSLLESLIKILTGTAILFCASQISLPWHPVPMTFQTVGVLLIGLVFPCRLALASILTYLALGFSGLPMFPGFRGGPAFLLDPTLGYFIGFVGAVLVMHRLPNNLVLRSLAGLSTIFICGLSVLTLFLGSLHQALLLGFYPFILPGIIKTLVLVAILKFFGFSKHAS